MNNCKPKRGEGMLPCAAPLATPYVPFQMNDSPKYEAPDGLVRGTLFPGLDLPFMGMVNESELPATPKNQLQALSFAIGELALYLDTHQDDQEALSLYRAYQQAYSEKTEAYQKEYGPLNHFTLCQGAYSWLKDPWPWEYGEK